MPLNRTANPSLIRSRLTTPFSVYVIGAKISLCFPLGLMRLSRDVQTCNIIIITIIIIIVKDLVDPKVECIVFKIEPNQESV